METATITRVEITQGVDGDYYAACFSSNGREIFKSSEGYRNYTDLFGAVKESWPNAEIIGPNGGK